MWCSVCGGLVCVYKRCAEARDTTGCWHWEHWEQCDKHSRHVKAYPTCCDILESFFKAQVSQLDRLFSLECRDRDVRAVSFGRAFENVTADGIGCTTLQLQFRYEKSRYKTWKITRYAISTWWLRRKTSEVGRIDVDLCSTHATQCTAAAAQI